MDDYTGKLRVPFGKLTSIFPQIILPTNHNQPVGDFIDKLVKELPIPTDLEINTAIISMKKVVDTQQLDIQMQMIQQQQQNMNNPNSNIPKHRYQTHLHQQPIFQEQEEYEQSHPQHQTSLYNSNDNKDWKWHQDDKDYYDFIN